MVRGAIARGLELLDAAGDAPFLLWLHYIDPHHPYSPPGGAAGDDLARYDAELTWLDGQLAPLLDRLATPPLADRTAVVVTADHGEEFGEHGGRFHARELYEESVRVPLVLRGPGVPAGVLRGTAWLHDVSPTLLDWLGVAPPARCQPEGRSLLPAAFAGDPLPRRPLPLRVSARGLGLRRALVWWPFKLLERHREGERVLFHLVDDPRETTDASARHPDVADSLRAPLAASR